VLTAHVDSPKVVMGGIGDRRGTADFQHRLRTTTAKPPRALGAQGLPSPCAVVTEWGIGEVVIKAGRTSRKIQKGEGLGISILGRGGFKEGFHQDVTVTAGRARL